MNHAQTFTVNGEDKGTTLRTDFHVYGELQSPRSYAFFCPCCGEVWARAVVPGQPFMVWTRPCTRHHTSSLEVPGSLLLSWDTPFNESFPAAMWQWELERHLALYDMA